MGFSISVRTGEHTFASISSSSPQLYPHPSERAKKLYVTITHMRNRVRAPLLFLCSVALFAAFPVITMAETITWTLATSTNQTGLNWSDITSSADGTKLAAVVRGGNIWTSTNSGATWTDETAGTSASDLSWTSITSSADGTHLAATENGPSTNTNGSGDIWISTDGGQIWTNATAGTNASGLDWVSITSSSDGTKLAAVENLDDGGTGQIWISSNGGATWTDTTAGTSASDLPWTSITSSADGTHLAATENSYGNPGVWTTSLIFSPSLTTSAASSLSNTGATFNGTITFTEGATSTVEGFVYGATTAYGATTTSSGSFGAGSFNAGVSALACNTTYHYAAYATNSQGTGYGNDESFNTVACPQPAAPPAGNGAIAGSGPNAPTWTGPAGHAIIPGAPIAPTPPASTATTPTTPPVPATPTTLTPAQTAQLVTLYTSLLQILEQEIATLKAVLGK